MRLNRSRTSSNIEDRRSGGSGLGRGGSLGIGGIVLALVAIYFGVDPNVVLNLVDEPASTTSASTVAPDDPQGQFVAKVLGDTEETWRSIFATQTNGQYPEPRLVLYRGATSTACGMGQAAMGPFYCPADQRVYLDLAFFDEMQRRLNAPGDFAQAYVIAHEVGHHVQNVLGIFEKHAAERQQPDRARANAVSVRMELQADCYAGVWAHHAQAQRAVLEPGDVEEALAAASAVGDDTLQRKAQGYVVPDAFTHGSAAQRMQWFQRGLDSGQLRDCDTFAAGG